MKKKRTLKQILAKLLVFALVFQLAVPVVAAPVAEDASVADAVEETLPEAAEEETLPEAAEEEIVAEGEGEEEFTFTIDDFGNITGFTGTLPETLVIPEEINDITVKGIEKGVFEGQTALKHVELPNTLYRLDGFMGCTNLETISLPKAPIALYIFSEAFRDCKNLMPLSFEDVSSVDIGEYAFAGCEKFKDYDWVLASGTYYGTLFLHDNSLAGLKVKSLTIKMHISVSGKEDSICGRGDETFENITNVYNVDSWVSCDFEQFASATPGATVVINQPDEADDIKNFDVPGVKEIQIAPNEEGWQVIDGVVYGPLNNNPDIRAQYVCKYAELENGVYYLPDGVHTYETFWIDNNIVKELVLPESMTLINWEVELNTYPVTVRLPKDTSVKRDYCGVANDGQWYREKQADITVVLPSTLDNYTVKFSSYADKVIIPSDMTVFDGAKIHAMFDNPEIILEEDHPTLMKVGNSIYSKDGKTLYWCGDKLNQGDMVEVPEGVETIAPSAYRVSTEIEPITVILPSSLKHYEKDAVYAKDADLRLVTTKCNDDVTVEPTSFVIKHLFVNDPATSPFVKAWGTNKIEKVISDGAVNVKIKVLAETEDGTTEKAPYGTCKVSLSKNTDSGVISATGGCMYLEDGSVEILLTEGGSYNFAFSPVEQTKYFPATVENVELTLGSSEDAGENVPEVTVILKKRPALRIESEDDIHGYIYAEDGTYHSEFDKRDYGIISDSLMPGNYKVVMCKESNQLMHQNHVSDFEKFGLLENEDYILKELVITEDTTEDVIWNDINFDILVDDQQALIESECSYTASGMDARFGYTNLDIRYAIDSEKWDASLESVKVMATLPDGVSYIEDSAYLVSDDSLQNEIFDVTIDGNVLTFTLDKDCLKGRIHFSVTTTENAEGISIAYVKGATTDFIGFVQFINKQLTIDSASPQFSKDGDFWINGHASTGDKVELFLGNAKLGSAKVYQNGKWSANLSIPDAVVGETYLITAYLSGDVPTDNPPSVEIECVDNPMEVIKIDYEYLTDLDTIQSTVNMSTMKGKKALSAANDECPFHIYVDIENDETIQELSLAYDWGKGPVYQGLDKNDAGKWVLNMLVGANGLPEDLSLVAKVKCGDKVKEVVLYDFVIKWIIDPSGYIYEAVPENRVEGATVTTYYKDETGNAVKWDAEEYGQVNPLISGKDGSYGWFVPAGEWMVRAEKQDYVTAESEWLPVPPPQLDVNLELVSTMEPKVAGVDLASDKMLVRFDNYVLADSVTAEGITLKDATEQEVEIASVEAVDVKIRNEDSIAKEFMVTFAPVAEGSYIATVAAGVKSYANVAMSEAQTVSDLTVAGIVKDIKTPKFFVTKAGNDCTFEVSVVSDEEVNGRLLTATSADESKVKVVSTTAADAEGNATITLNGPAMTVTEITLGVENSSFTKTVSVMVIENEEVFDKMFELNDLTKPQVPSGNEGSEVPSEPEKPSKPEKKDPFDLAKATVAAITNQVYTGSALTPAVTVTADGKTLVKDTDYTVAYKNNTNAGTAEVTITGKGNYTGSKTFTFTIDKADSTAKFEKDVYQKAYGAKKFTVKVTDATGMVTFKSSNTKVVKIDKNGKVTIKGTGRAVITATIAEGKNYKAETVETVIEVSPKKASVKKLSVKKNQLTVTWKKDSKTTGYEVIYSTSKKFKKAKTVLVKKTKTTKTTLKNLKKGKTYYVKVRAYKEVKVGNKKVKIYSPYSKTLKKKIK